MKNFVFTLILLIRITSFAQNSAWNPTSFAFHKDTALLENMTGATPVSFGSSAPEASNLIIFPNGFSFHYGLNYYNSFSISSLGFICLGAAITSYTPETHDNVIVPLCNSTRWYTASYKLTGTAPYRKLTIQWIGTMQPSGEPTSFQLWLFEQTGQIQFVYKSLRGFFGYNNNYNYKIFCKSTILQNTTIAALPIKSNNVMPVVNYSSIPGSFDSIYANTRFSFVPDTNRPATPSALSFQNLNAGCLTIQFVDNSDNESLFQLDRADDGIVFKGEKSLFVNSPSGSTTQLYNQGKLQPYWNYTYRLFASNGFINSDTLTATIQTLMPQLNGIKTVPGDYPSITALLQDAACKHLGPDLIIELQNNYSPSAETWPVYFVKSLQNRFIKSVTIRPAANADITISVTARALFVIDSVRHIGFDGRAGGNGTIPKLNLKQQNDKSPAIWYTNAADSGFVNYCNISIPSFSTVGNKVVYISYRDTGYIVRKDVNAFTLSNSILHSESDASTDLFYAEAKDSTGCSGLKIVNNQFYGFTRSAVSFAGGGSNSIIGGNKFFQLQQIKLVGVATVTDIAGTCVRLTGTENNIAVDGNYFGGNSAVWGQGIYKIDYNTIGRYHFIHYLNSRDKTCFIRNNHFGNIAGITSGILYIIYARGGEVTIDNNRIGTADSLASITNSDFFYGMDLWQGKKFVTNNFFSGMHGKYPSGFNNMSYFIASSFVDSIYIAQNDIGGSDNVNANTNGGHLSAITGALNRISVIRNNIIRGMSIRAGDLCGIDFEGGLTNAAETLIADSNYIHDLQGWQFVKGITAVVNSNLDNLISHNTIYGLSVKGSDQYNNGYLTGIYLKQYNYAINGTPTVGEAHVFNNNIHSFYKTGTAQSYSMNAIIVFANKAGIYNNFIRLGINPVGQGVGTNCGLLGIESTANTSYIEHNNIYMGGNATSATGVRLISGKGTQGEKTLYVTNNIVQLDLPVSNFNGSYYFAQGTSAAVSAKNLWYSVTDTAIATRLLKFQKDCNCDSSTFIANPKFIDPTGDSAHVDLHVQNTGGGESAGTPSVLDIKEDIDLQNRNQTTPVDIGADAALSCAGGTLPALMIALPTADLIVNCNGSPVMLTANVSGGNFQQLKWQYNLNDIANSNTTSIQVNKAGVYRVVGLTSCGQVASRQVTIVDSIRSHTVKIESLSPGVTPCDSGRMQFTTVASSAISLYKWYRNGVVEPAYTNQYASFDFVIQNDLFKVEAIRNTGCGAFIASDSFRVNVVIPASRSHLLLSSYDTLVCLNGKGSIKYKTWADGSGTVKAGLLPINPASLPHFVASGDSMFVFDNVTDAFSFRMFSYFTSGGMCAINDSSQLIKVYVAGTPVITQNGGVLTSSMPSGNQWYKDGAAIPQATGQSFTATTSGVYSVQVKANGCNAISSNTITVVITAVNSVSLNRAINFVPNPVRDKLNIQVSGYNMRFELQVLDLSGRNLLTRTSFTQSYHLDMSNYSTGAYIIRVVNTKNGDHVQRLIVKQ